MLAHSSYILQPLDVGCFGPLKASYSKQIENLVRLQFNYITKLEFLSAFKEAFDTVFTEKNIKSGFQATGIVPYDPERVLSNLDLQLRTPTPPLITEQDWVSKTLQNTIELEKQGTYVKNKIIQHQNSSPSSIYTAYNHLLKGSQIIAHELILTRAENKALQEANQAKKRRQNKTKHRIHQGTMLTFDEASRLRRSPEIQLGV